MTRERRGARRPIPLNYSKYINEAQKITLNKMLEFGWDIKFIRRPLFQEPIVVMETTSKELKQVYSDGLWEDFTDKRSVG